MMVIILILKVLLTIALAVLGFALAVTAVALFVPVKYFILFEKDENFCGSVRVTWLMGALSYVYDADGEGGGESLVKIFGVDVKNYKKLFTFRKKLPIDNDNDDKPNGDEKVSKTITESAEERAAPSEQYAGEHGEPPPKPSTRKTEKTGKRRKFKFKTPKSLDSNKDEKKANKIWLTAKAIVNYKHKGEVTAKTIEFIKKVWAAVKPAKSKVRLTVGLSSPDLTGVLLGALYAFFGKSGGEFVGSFDEEVLKGRVYAEGRVYAVSLAMAAAAYLLNRNVRELLLKAIGR